jgi:hypothetical protein
MKSKTYRQTGGLPPKEWSRENLAAKLRENRARWGNPKIARYENGRIYQWPHVFSPVYSYLVIAH